MQPPGSAQNFVGSCPHSAWPDAAHVPAMVAQLGKQPCSQPAGVGDDAEPDQASCSAARAAAEAFNLPQDSAAGLRHRQAVRSGGRLHQEASKPPLDPNTGAKLSAAAASDEVLSIALPTLWRPRSSNAALEKQYGQWMAEQLCWVGDAGALVIHTFSEGTRAVAEQAAGQSQDTPGKCMHAASLWVVHIIFVHACKPSVQNGVMPVLQVDLVARFLQAAVHLGNIFINLDAGAFRLPPCTCMSACLTACMRGLWAHCPLQPSCPGSPPVLPCRYFAFTHWISALCLSRLLVPVLLICLRPAWFAPTTRLFLINPACPSVVSCCVQQMLCTGGALVCRQCWLPVSMACSSIAEVAACCGARCRYCRHREAIVTALAILFTCAFLAGDALHQAKSFLLPAFAPPSAAPYFASSMRVVLKLSHALARVHAGRLFTDIFK